MAMNLACAGVRVIAHSRSDQARAGLVASGAQWAASAAEVAEVADTVITMLPDTSDVQSVIDGDAGLSALLRRGALVIDMSTIDPSSAQELGTSLTRRGVLFVDAPVSGGETGAVAGTLSIMVGGTEEAVRRATPLLRILGTSVTHIGPVGAGQVAKACNQLLVGTTIQAVAEALTLAERSGVDPRLVREAMLSGLASSTILERHGLRMLDNQFAPGFRSRLHAKDARIVVSAAEAVGAELPAFRVVRAQLESLVAAGHGDLDHAALYSILRPNANLVS